MITYMTGDAVYPATTAHTKLVHICNNKGGWGAGFVIALSARSNLPEIRYRNMKEYKLGTIAATCIPECTHKGVTYPGLDVINMIAQNRCPGKVDYTALFTCLETLRARLLPSDVVVMPRIGCGLGGGNWAAVSEIINRTLFDIDVIVYDLPE